MEIYSHRRPTFYDQIESAGLQTTVVNRTPVLFNARWKLAVFEMFEVAICFKLHVNVCTKFGKAENKRTIFRLIFTTSPPSLPVNNRGKGLNRVAMTRGPIIVETGLEHNYR